MQDFRVWDIGLGSRYMGYGLGIQEFELCRV